MAELLTLTRVILSNRCSSIRKTWGSVLMMASSFFRDMFHAGFPSFWVSMRVSYDGDTYTALPVNVRSIDWAVCYTKPAAAIEWMLT